MDRNECNLLTDLKNSKKEAFEYFFYNYYNNLLYVANQYLNDLDEAEEIVQEVFYRVWYYRKNIDPSLSFKSYIITIAKRLIFNKTKKEINRVTYEKYYKANHKESQNSLEDYLEFHELDQQINNKIDLLPPKRKEIFIMSRQEGMSHKEIACKLNISTNTVENHISKAIKFLKDSIIYIFLLFNLM